MTTKSHLVIVSNFKQNISSKTVLPINLSQPSNMTKSKSVKKVQESPTLEVHLQVEEL